MATIRQRILQLKAMGYSTEECWREVHSSHKDCTKTYVQQVLAKNAGESNHQRRTELIYEMCLEILANQRLLLHAFKPDTVKRAMDRMELREHPPKTTTPLPEGQDRSGL